MYHLGSIVARNARYRPDETALVIGTTRVTWSDFAQRVWRVANAFASLGLRKGDAIALVLTNGPEIVELYWAAATAGYVAVPLSPLLRGKGLQSLLSDSGARAIVAGPELAPVLDEIRSSVTTIAPDCWLITGADVPAPYRSYATLTAAAPNLPPAVALDRDDPCNIIYSSGTTGLPKGIVHTQAIRATYCTTFAAAFRMRPESVVMHAGSLVFNGGLVTFFPSFFLGCRYVLLPKFDATTFIETVARERVTHVMTVPSQLTAILDSPACTREAFSSLEMLCSVGAPLHREHKERLRAVAPDALYELYGLTEGFITILDRTDYDRKMDSVGTPTYFNEMRIVGDDGRDLSPGEVGEIVGRGPMMMPGYHGRPDLTAEAIRDGWLFTGDLGFADTDGFLHLVDRKKDLIISGGVNVFPKDIEEVLVQHPAVREAAVFGVPHDKWGEAPVGAVLLKAERTVTPEELRAWVNARVDARFQQLCEVVIHDEFPRSAAGKTLKRLMREPYWEGKTAKI